MLTGQNFYLACFEYPVSTFNPAAKSAWFRCPERVHESKEAIGTNTAPRRAERTEEVTGRPRDLQKQADFVTPWTGGWVEV